MRSDIFISLCNSLRPPQIQRVEVIKSDVPAVLAFLQCSWIRGLEFID